MRENLVKDELYKTFIQLIQKKQQHQDSQEHPIGIFLIISILFSLQVAKGCCSSWQVWCLALCSWSCSAALYAPAALRPWNWN